MAKEREEHEEREEASGASAAAPSADRDEPNDDNEPDVRVGERDGKVVVDGTHETRGQKRARERREEQERRDAADRRRDELIAGMQATLNTLAGAMANGRQAPGAETRQKPGASEGDVDAEWLRHSERQEELAQLMRQAGTRGDLDRLRKEWHALEYRKQRLAASHAMKPELDRVRESTRQAEPYEITRLRQEFKDVLEHPVANRVAAAAYEDAKAMAELSGQPFDPIAAHRAACTRAAERVLKRRPAAPEPSEAQRGRFGGTGPNSGQSSAGGFSRELGPRERRMAIEWAKDSGIPSDKATEAWVKMMLREDRHYFRDNPAL